jgi:hypothetical protein
MRQDFGHIWVAGLGLRSAKKLGHGEYIFVPPCALGQRIVEPDDHDSRSTDAEIHSGEDLDNLVVSSVPYSYKEIRRMYH